MGSLFDGIGGFPLAAIRNGILPVWASEIEAFPIAVTRLRFPDMVHVGDITKLNGAGLPPVDIICGGRPCQDLSVAGARAGLPGSRSGLFMEQTRITKEMRDADERRGRTGIHVRPRFFIVGKRPRSLFFFQRHAQRRGLPALSWKKSSALKPVVFQSLNLTPGAGNLLGESYWELISPWRGDASTLNTGVSPQRRKRIFLVADFAGQSAEKILFDQESLLGYPAPGL